MNRRVFLRQLAVAVGSFSLGACGLLETPAPSPTPTPSQTPSPSPTATSSPYPTRTSTPLPSPTPTSTATPTPVFVGTLPPSQAVTIDESNLGQVVELARWGKGTVNDLAWAPSGGRLAAATDLGVYLYDPATFQPSGFLNAGPTRRIVFYPSGTPLFSAGEQLLRWDVQSGQSQAMALLPNPFAIGLSPDGNALGVLSQPPGKSAQFQRSDSGSILTLEDSGLPFTAAVLSRDLGLIAAHTKDGPTRVWRADGGKLLDLPAAKQAPGALAFAPDGRSLAVGYPDLIIDFLNTNMVRVFSLPDGQVRYDLYPEGGVEGAEESLLSLAFSPDGKHIAAGFANNSARIWRAEPGPVERKLLGKGVPSALAYSPDGQLLAGGGLDLWRISDGLLLGSVEDHFSPFHDMVLSPGGDLAALAMFEHIELRLVSDGSLLRSISSPKQVNGVCFSPDGSLLCGACSDGTARLWRVRDGRFLTLIGEPTQRLWANAFSPDGKIIIFGGENGLIQFYEIEKDLVTRQVREPYIATRLAFSPVGTLFASLTSAGINIRDLNGSLTRSTAGVGLQDMSFSPDGGWLAIAGNEILRVFDLGTGKDVYSFYDPARGRPASLAFSPEGAFLAVGREDGRIDFFWGADGTYLRTLSGHHGRVIRLGFTPASRQLISAGEDGTIRVWGPG